MDSSHLEALTRIASLSRRSAVAAMMAASGTLAALATGEAKQKHKGQDCGKKERQRCTADAASCRTVFLEACQGSQDDCAAEADCCARCSADGVLTCLLALQNGMTAPRLT